MPVSLEDAVARLRRLPTWSVAKQVQRAIRRTKILHHEIRGFLDTHHAHPSRPFGCKRTYEEIPVDPPVKPKVAANGVGKYLILGWQDTEVALCTHRPHSHARSAVDPKTRACTS